MLPKNLLSGQDVQTWGDVNIVAIASGVKSDQIGVGSQAHKTFLVTIIRC